MNDSFDIGLVNTGSLVKKGYSYIVANVGKTVALITLAVTALVSFTEISFSGINTASFTSTLIMMLIASYVMYFSLEDAGERLGRESEEYKTVAEMHREMNERIKGCDIADLRDFCLEYRNAELEYRRENLLFSLGYTKDEFEAYKNGAKMSKKACKALGRVEKIKSAELDAPTLISNEGQKKSELINPESTRLFGMITKLIPSSVCMLFTVSVMISVKDNMTAAGVIEAILKLSTLPVIGLKGYSGGYQYVMNSEIAWLKTKSRLLDTFLKRSKYSNTSK